MSGIRRVDGSVMSQRELMGDAALANLTRDLGEISENPRLFRLADTFEHALSEHEIVKADKREWAKPARDAGLPWAWRLRVGNDVLIGGCRTRRLCDEKVKEHRRRLKALARGRLPEYNGRKLEEA